MKASLPKTHLLYIDSLRALAAIYVVMHHATLQYYELGHNNLSGIKKAIINLFVFGHYAVDLFIVLSGFSLMLSVVKNNYTLKGGNFLFYKRRVIRIIPPYYLAMIFSLVLIYFFIGSRTGTHWDVSIPVSFSDILKHSLLISDYFREGGAHINHVFWSVMVECRIYLFFPLLVWIWRTWGVLITLCASVLISIIGSMLLLYAVHHNTNLTTSGSGISPYIILFTLGMIAADVSFSLNNIPKVIREWYLSSSRTQLFIYFIVVLLIFVGVNYIAARFIPKSNSEIDIIAIFKDITVGVFAALILSIVTISVSYSKTMAFPIKLLLWQPLVFVGTFSYSLYLIHAPLLQLITQYILTPLHFSNYLSCLLLLLLTPIIIIFSYFFFYVFERPFLNMGKRKSIKNIEINVVENPAP